MTRVVPDNLTDRVSPAARETLRDRFAMVRWAIVIALLANLTIVGVRLITTISRGDLVETTGTERVPIYGVWKAERGLPVYENPFGDTFAVSLYNFGFYRLYGGIANALGWHEASLVLGARLITTGFACLVVGVFAYLLRSVCRSPGSPVPSWGWALLAATLTVFSSAGVSWFFVTVRPDMASLLFALIGLALYVKSRDAERSDGLLVAASVSFFAAWAFKQSTIGILGGICLAALVARQWRALPALVLPFVALCGITLVLGGDSYRLNVLTAPALAHFRLLKNANLNLFIVFLPCVHLWGLPFVLAWCRATHRTPSKHTDADGSLRPLGIVAAVSFAWCVVALTRDGGYRNTLLEAYFVISLLAFAVLWRRGDDLCSTSFRSVVVAALFLTGALFPVAQVLAHGRLGDVTLTPAAYAEAGARLASRLHSMPPPVFVEDSPLAEPWHSTRNQYPAVVLDNYFYLAARAQGRLGEAGVDHMIRDHHFGALLLSGRLNLTAAAREAGYVRVPLSSEEDQWRLELYVRP